MSAVWLHHTARSYHRGDVTGSGTDDAQPTRCTAPASGGFHNGLRRRVHLRTHPCHKSCAQATARERLQYCAVKWGARGGVGQDEHQGGISDRPEDMCDVFHTFFGIAALSLMGHPGLVAIDPMFALPVETVDRLRARRRSSQEAQGAVVSAATSKALPVHPQEVS